MPGENGYPRTARASNRPFDYVGLRGHDVGHETSDARPSGVSRAYVEKAGCGLGQG